MLLKTLVKRIFNSMGPLIIRLLSPIGKCTAERWWKTLFSTVWCSCLSSLGLLDCVCDCSIKHDRYIGGGFFFNDKPKGIRGEISNEFFNQSSTHYNMTWRMERHAVFDFQWMGNWGIHLLPSLWKVKEHAAENVSWMITQPPLEGKDSSRKDEDMYIKLSCACHHLGVQMV